MLECRLLVGIAEHGINKSTNIHSLATALDSSFQFYFIPRDRNKSLLEGKSTN